MALSEQFSMHTPHWHGHVVLHDGKRTDVVPLLQAQMETVDMAPDNPGMWMFHCHIDDHMEAGMATLYKVEPQMSWQHEEEMAESFSIDESGEEKPGTRVALTRYP